MFSWFSWFLEKLKKNNSFGANFGAHLEILELIWKSAAPKTSLFERLLSQGDLQIHLPNETTKEKVMWGRVQCKIEKQRLAKIILTRSAGSFSGPGADFWSHRILKGVPKFIIFEKIQKNEKNEVQETALKKHDFGLIFDVKMRGLKW